MCHPKPGPRCSDHAKTAWDKSKSDLSKAKESGDLASIAKAKEVEERNRYDYFTTSSGQDMLEQKIKQAESAGNPALAGKIRQIKDEAAEARQHQLESFNRIKEAQKNSPAAVAAVRPVPRPQAVPRPRLPQPTGPRRGALAAQTSQEMSRLPKDRVKHDGTPTSTNGYGFKILDHAYKQCAEKGFKEEQLCNTFKNPKEIYPSRSHPGQHRITGEGLCLVGEFRGDKFEVITVYLDRVVTAPRADQMNTAEGREFAARFAQHGTGARDGLRVRR